MKNKFSNIASVLAVVLLVGALSCCSNNETKDNKDQPSVKVEEKTVEAKKSYSNITPEEAKNRLDSEEEIILLDVRTKEEYDAGHIKDSLLIPVDALQNEAEDTLKDKDAAIFVYCRSGNRSATASKILVELGYTKVYDLGGIRDWPYEIEK
jgi:rhodanese-related sulfurtransferase